MAEHLTVAETAAALGVSIRTVRRWVKDGTLAGAVRLPGRGGGEWRIPQATIDRLLTEGVPRSTVNPIDTAAKCQGVKANGTRCRELAMRGSRFCRHHQDQEEQR